MSQTKEIRTVKSCELIPAVAGLLSEGRNVKITVTGNSMYPFLRHGLDAVSLAPVELHALKSGDVVLVKRDNGQYVLHRMVKRCLDSVLILGDAQQDIEGPLRLDQVIAVVTQVWRGDLIINCNGLGWRTCSRLWHHPAG
ncbi:MAG: S24/S26 family peptidase [Syntrophomonadales bacterium]|jgi:signal peptidase